MRVLPLLLLILLSACGTTQETPPPPMATKESVIDLIEKRTNQQNLSPDDIQFAMVKEKETDLLFVTWDQGTHVGMFWVFQPQANSWHLVGERNWKVESPIPTANLSFQGKALYEVQEHFGGTGGDGMALHVVHVQHGMLVDAWEGIGTGWVTPPNGNPPIYVEVGSYRLLEDNGKLFSWKTAYFYQEDMETQTQPPKTEHETWTWDGTQFRKP